MTRDNNNPEFNERLLEILESENPKAFSFISDEISFKPNNKNREIFTIDNIKHLRTKGFQSYGCCSFDDPIHDLQNMGWL